MSAFKYLAAAALGALLLVAVSNASAAPSATDLGKKAKALLSQKGFHHVLTADANVDAIGLEDPSTSSPTALEWASSEVTSGRTVLVPAQFVDGKDRPYGGSGLPTEVLGLLPADAASLLQTGLYVEVVS